MLDVYHKVADFHEKYGFTVGKKLRDEPDDPDMCAAIHTIANVLRGQGILALRIWEARGDKSDKDDRLYRVHLMCEELAEVVAALAQLDHVNLCKELADLIYTTVGTAVTYNIPIHTCADAVHVSNMSKSRDSDDPRMRAKDPERGYRKADIINALLDGIHDIHRSDT